MMWQGGNGYWLPFGYSENKDKKGFWGEGGRTYKSLIDETPFEVLTSDDYAKAYFDLGDRKERYDIEIIEEDGNLNGSAKKYANKFGLPAAILLSYPWDFYPRDSDTFMLLDGYRKRNC